MIDPTTLPRTTAGVTISAGTTYEVKGLNFNLWPSGVVLSFIRSYALEEEVPSLRLFREVSRTDTSMVFQVDVASNFTSDHIWGFFAAPNNTPREILQYTTL